MTSSHPDFRQLGARTFGALCLAGLVAGACGGSLSANANAKASSDSGADADFDADANASGNAGWDTVDASQSEADTMETAELSQPGQATAPQETALLGARHDLMIQNTSAACQCLAVVLGQPSSVGIVWTGRRPTTNPQSQLVIALGSDGVPCSEAGPGASYWGYEVKDGDVIVKVEAAVAGRPVTHGAIIPRPVEGKQVYIEPTEKIPYGRGLRGEARCALGPGR